MRNAASTSAQAYFHFAKTYESKRLQAKEDPWKAASECSKIFEDVSAARSTQHLCA